MNARSNASRISRSPRRHRTSCDRIAHAPSSRPPPVATSRCRSRRSTSRPISSASSQHAWRRCAKSSGRCAQRPRDAMLVSIFSRDDCCPRSTRRLPSHCSAWQSRMPPAAMAAKVRGYAYSTLAVMASARGDHAAVVAVLADEFVDRHEFLDGLHEQRLRQLRQGHPHRGGAEALRILVGPEQRDAAVAEVIGLEALEDFLPVVQHGGGGIERDRFTRAHLRVVPAAVLGPADGDHVIGEDLAEPGVLQHLGARSVAHGLAGRLAGKGDRLESSDGRSSRSSCLRRSAFGRGGFAFHVPDQAFLGYVLARSAPTRLADRCGPRRMAPSTILS